MRIIYLTESTGWSGGTQQVLWMAEALQKRGHDLVLAFQPGSDILTGARVANRVKKLMKQVLHAQHSTAHAIGLAAAYAARVPGLAVTRRVAFPLKNNAFSHIKYRSKWNSETPYSHG